MGITGTITILTSHLSNDLILPTIVSSFREQYPIVYTRVEILPSDEIIKSIIGGAGDVGFCSILPQEEGFEYIEMAEEELVLIVYPGHIFFRQDDIYIADLADEHLIVREEVKGSERGFPYVLNIPGFDLLKNSPKMICSTNAGIVSLVESKIGVGIVTRHSARKSEALGLIKIINFKDANLKFKLYCIFRNKGSSRPLIDAFIEVLKSTPKSVYT